MFTTSIRAPRATAVALLLTLTLHLGSALSPRALAEQEPVAVLAVSGLDPLLEDIDLLFAAGEAPQHARKLRAVITVLNDLRGLDRQRPLGVYLYFPAAGEQDPQPLLFFPVANRQQLQTALQIGDDLQLLPGPSDDHLILHTDDGDFPVKLQHRFAFVDPTKSGVRLSQTLPDPLDLISEPLAGQDGVLVIRREGLPPALIELALGHIRAEALKLEPQQENEKAAEYALRVGVHNAVFSLMESAVQEWQGAVVRWKISADRTAHLEASIRLAPDGRTVAFLRSVHGDSSRFTAQTARDAAVSLTINWQPTLGGRELLQSLVATLREQVTSEVAEADERLQQAVFGVMDALETTVSGGTSDSFLRLIRRPEQGFLLLGGTSVAGAPKLAAGLQRLLPFAAESNDIRTVEMNVASAGDVAIHRIQPAKLRKRDRRLYGDDAAIYLAAGRDAMWVAFGGEGTAAQLAGTIQRDELPSERILARPRSLTGSVATPGDPTFLDLSVDAGEWVDLVRTQGAASEAHMMKLASRAFQGAEDDGLRLWVQSDEQGLGIHLHLEGGYVRLLGLLLAERMNRQ